MLRSKKNVMPEMLARILLKVGDANDLRFLQSNYPRWFALNHTRKIPGSKVQAFEVANPDDTLTLDTVKKSIISWAPLFRARYGDVWRGTMTDFILSLAEFGQLPQGFSEQQYRTVIGKTIAQATDIPIFSKREVLENGTIVMCIQISEDAVMK
jgi:hypothetical protein